MATVAHAQRYAVVAVPLVLVPALGLVQGGYPPDTWVWSGALAAWAVALAVVLSGDPGALRRAWPWAVAAGALTAWTLLSAIWSVTPAQSLLDARRSAVYAAVVLALLVLARREGVRDLPAATHAAVSALLVYALARYLFGTRHADTFESFLLHQPLGYANAVGVLAAMGLLLAVGLAATGPRRAATAATVPPLALALTLGWPAIVRLALVAGLAGWNLLVFLPKALQAAKP